MRGVLPRDNNSNFPVQSQLLVRVLNHDDMLHVITYYQPISKRTELPSRKPCVDRKVC